MQVQEKITKRIRTRIDKNGNVVNEVIEDLETKQRTETRGFGEASDDKPA